MLKLGFSRSLETSWYNRTVELSRKRLQTFSFWFQVLSPQVEMLVHPVHPSDFKIYCLSLRVQRGTGFRSYLDFLIASFLLQIELYITVVHTVIAISSITYSKWPLFRFVLHDSSFFFSRIFNIALLGP